ncbi:hypothetical protein [Streptomyces sp. SPB162]|uniref:hypothetical protein n=1 Tax=Streptomyces sp. SPB162 TaxID=2940560 RepID=UPI002405FC39|nr:hypothetical protein [Streptomyces sp. SPB162]MDF9814192.1 hypothetical protein [Streptomyces sp. SPB162]
MVLERGGEKIEFGEDVRRRVSRNRLGRATPGDGYAAPSGRSVVAQRRDVLAFKVTVPVPEEPFDRGFPAGTGHQQVRVLLQQ